uniref:Uncharacterized protein n=1 Tax=Physcomitrium patens TaxID=3218 RepID=A0A7I4FE36_PHYPA
ACCAACNAPVSYFSTSWVVTPGTSRDPVADVDDKPDLSLTVTADTLVLPRLFSPTLPAYHCVNGAAVKSPAGASLRRTASLNLSSAHGRNRAIDANVIRLFPSTKFEYASRRSINSFILSRLSILLIACTAWVPASGDRNHRHTHVTDSLKSGCGTIKRAVRSRAIDRSRFHYGNTSCSISNILGSKPGRTRRYLCRARPVLIPIPPPGRSQPVALCSPAPHLTFQRIAFVPGAALQPSLSPVSIHVSAPLPLSHTTGSSPLSDRAGFDARLDELPTRAAFNAHTRDTHTTATRLVNTRHPSIQPPTRCPCTTSLTDPPRLPQIEPHTTPASADTPPPPQVHNSITPATPTTTQMHAYQCNHNSRRNATPQLFYTRVAQNIVPPTATPTCPRDRSPLPPLPSPSRPTTSPPISTRTQRLRLPEPPPPKVLLGAATALAASSSPYIPLRHPLHPRSHLQVVSIEFTTCVTNRIWIAKSPGPATFACRCRFDSTCSKITRTWPATVGSFGSRHSTASCIHFSLLFVSFSISTPNCCTRDKSTP